MFPSQPGMQAQHVVLEVVEEVARHPGEVGGLARATCEWIGELAPALRPLLARVSCLPSFMPKNASRAAATSNFFLPWP